MPLLSVCVCGHAADALIEQVDAVDGFFEVRNVMIELLILNVSDMSPQRRFMDRKVGHRYEVCDI